MTKNMTKFTSTFFMVRPLRLGQPPPPSSRAKWFNYRYI